MLRVNQNPQADAITPELYEKLPYNLKVQIAWQEFWQSRGTKMCGAYNSESRVRCVNRQRHSLKGVKHKYQDENRKVEW